LEASSRNRSDPRRLGDRLPSRSEAAGTVEPAVDDWFGEGLDWFEDAGRAGGEPSAGAEPGRFVGSEPAYRGGAGTERSALVRRRQLVGLGVLGLLLAAAVITPLVVFGGGGKTVEATTTAAPTVVTTTTPTPPARTTTTPSSTSQTPTPARLRVTLPASGALRRGDKGSAVETLQKALVALGFSPGRPDGVFGVNTEAAVVDFQRSNGLQPDGIVGKETARLLNTGLANRANGG
jgi:hypothetical protein